jgi:hypothetical protein
MSYKPTAFINLFCFRAQRIDYFKFYKTIPAQEAFSQLKQQIPNITENSFCETSKMLLNNIKNVVFTIESYSAEFMKMYGNQNAITPLDSLFTKVYFTNLYSRNRTVEVLKP